MLRARWFLISLAALAALFAGAARGDQIVLRAGGQIEGEIVEEAQGAEGQYVVRLADGNQISLPAAQVARVVTRSEAERHYDRLLPQMPHTAEGNWKMAEWCLGKGLRAEREFHLQRVIELNPDHEPARRALGYNRIGGAWLKPNEFREGRGEVRYQGQWLLPQEIELRERQRVQKDAVDAWSKNINMWVSWLGKRRHDEAVKNFEGIRDPLAAPAIAALLDKETDATRQKFWIKILGRLECVETVNALIKVSLEEDSSDLRLTALEEMPRSGYVAARRIYLKELSSKDNKRVNRAGVGLAHVGDAATMKPLIDSLVTTHKYVVQSGNPGGIGAQFGGGAGGGGGGLSAGSSTKIIEQKRNNEEVLAALIKITGGVNFRFDQERWRAWYVQQQADEGVNLRRDE